MIKHPEKLRLLIDRLLGENNLREYAVEEQARMIHGALNRAGIDTWLMVGTVDNEDTTIEEHFWNECDGLTIDFSLRNYFADSLDVPHGVFADTGGFVYEGAEIRPKEKAGGREIWIRLNS